ncbi:3-hydroxyisobutyryl-Coenzyme A hydrolase [Heterostelium album PN500]|uniref:3-hydroxyisobutyryl-CoA hydrolase n=1 Tax=Heterostelium pallidum (strain ATCC 26659 / Pp 5 / PN500) TaxID=670386 RepID=D3B388_HETP5|nr:3-hydroxyisobutyryl-Coenzyme A hydrolase [Heterostelium album PN500]EFA83786.1 3-hydroxyisobutyryl-Coenzyme A hydrolase [Heterostelium album PN500]|eukprot:XP_020435903.1 3-hydroxyisobutyryl-Coenzyme A hydrolase [Heterostelium album PN500]
MNRINRLTRLIGNQFQCQRYYSTNTNEVLIDEQGKVINILLNRPEALNALSLPMVRKLTPLYQRLHQSKDGDAVVVMKGAGGKAFCAGGDIRSIYDTNNPKTRNPSVRPDDTFFREEYVLNNMIGTNPVPQVSIYNGFTMGGGVGLSIHGRFRVATDNTVFAMPETGIGFFCDVGGSYFLPRLAHHTGMYLGLTGAKIKGKDCYITGVATHYIPNARVPELEKALAALSSPTESAVNEVLDSFHEKVDINDNSLISSKFQLIEKTFSKRSVEQIIEALKADGSDWSKQNISTLSKMSPTSLKVVYQQIVNGGQLPTLADCLKMELRMAQTFVENNDFFEGVRALLVDKDKNPKWKPETLEQVTDSMVAKYFDTHGHDLKL